MKTILVDIIDPKAQKLLEDLADMNLIALKNGEESLMDLLNQLQEQGSKSGLTEDDVFKEIKLVRSERHA